MQKRYTKLGLKINTIIIMVVLFLTLIVTLFMGAVRGVVELPGVKEYLFKSVAEMKVWEIWLIIIASILMFGGRE